MTQFLLHMQQRVAGGFLQMVLLEMESEATELKHPARKKKALCPGGLDG
jgi:hypothetical protein